VKTSDAVQLVATRLAEAGIEEPRREARMILVAALRTDAAGLLAADDVSEALFEPLVARREAREPLAYILGYKEFWSLQFEVSPATLIPRPESETLIEAAIAALPVRNTVRRILDLGTGTGCLLLAALHEFPAAFGVGIDLSPQAAALARRNAETLGLARRAMFLAGHWASALAAKFDLILANPPYIASPELPQLMPEVKNFEPRAALDGGADGLSAYREIIAALPGLLAPAGMAILELGVGQSAAVAGLAVAAGFTAAARPDLGGIPRALCITAPLK
jgi:release factor glutamine methyltransferase